MYENFTAEALTVATELDAAGFEIRVPAREAELGRRLDWFQFRKDGRIGYHYAHFLADHNWSMPIKPSRGHGSGMFVDAAEDAKTAIESAAIITQEFNVNPLVGHHANYADSHALNGYVTV
ncbi:hypothetical protein ACQPUH_15345 [Clostridium perfringens]|uniref:hypothetical protein n=1 Tax=Clostridium perfringens TaxID=1502 RepID=UPI003D340CA1